MENENKRLLVDMPVVMPHVSAAVYHPVAKLSRHHDYKKIDPNFKRVGSTLSFALENHANTDSTTTTTVVTEETKSFPKQDFCQLVSKTRGNRQS